ncbi:MAG: hypothetical protein WC917_03410, partial [Bacilli bacterium]
MASRYWVGGSNNWDGTVGTKWATTSGGAGGASIPTSSDDVFFDANSGSVTITSDFVGNCLNLTCTGFTGTHTGTAGVYVRGNLVLDPTGTYSTAYAMSGSGSTTLTTNGATIKTLLVGSAPADSTMTLVGHLIVTQLFRPVSNSSGNATFNANGYNVTCGQFWATDNTFKILTINMGSGTWTITGYDNQFNASSTWDVKNSFGDTVINPSTSTIKFTNNSSNIKTLTGITSFTYNNVWVATQGSGVFKINKSNTFNNLKIDPGRTVQFTDATNQTVSSLTWDGTLGNVITVTGTATGGWTITDTSGSNVVNYCNISYSTATGGAVFDAQNTGNVNGGNNTGWSFALSVSVSDQINTTESKTVLIPTNFVSVYDLVNITSNETKTISQFTTTQAVSSIGTLTATGNGTIVSIGSSNATLRGVVWSTSTWGNPGNIAPAASNYGSKAESSGSFGTGAFTSSIT